jgi:Mg-chelatase subunit ChlD
MADDLKTRDYVVVIDRSGSMGEATSSTNSTSRWNTAAEATLALARKCQELDSDGIDVYTFNTSFKKYPNTTADKVKDIFNGSSPSGGTDFVPVLKDIFDNHFKKADKPTTVIVVTDGQPSDGASGQRALAKLIIDTTKRMEGDAELGVSFIQIGQDNAAREFLKKLDDELQAAGAKFDIVDTKTYDELNEISIEQALLDAVND